MIPQYDEVILNSISQGMEQSILVLHGTLKWSILALEEVFVTVFFAEYHRSVALNFFQHW